MKTVIKASAVVLAVFVLFYVGIWQWGMSRIYVEPGEILVVSAKFGNENPDPDNVRVVPEGTQGVWRDVKGEGRHFYNPVEYRVETGSAVTEIGPEKWASWSP